MKKTITLFALSLASTVLANCPNGNCQGGYSGGGYSNGYRDGQHNQSYYQGRDGYYQNQAPRNDYYQRNPQSGPSQNQSYSQDRSQGYYNQNDNRGYYDNRQNDYDGRQNNQMNGSDLELDRKVHDLLGSGWMSSGYPNVSYDISDGNVTLRGSVETIDEKNKIEEKIRKIEGVREVNNQITVSGKNTAYNDNRNSQYAPPQNYQDQSQQYDQRSNYDEGRQDMQLKGSDGEVAKKVRDQLSSGWISSGYPHVTYDVKDGYVTLRGSVETVDDKNKLEEKMRKIDGVRQVNNQITVSGKNSAYNDASKVTAAEKKYPQDYAATDADRMLNAKIRDKFSGWFTDEFETLTLKTNNGVVTIIGIVEKPEDVKRINDKLKSVDGVASVNNQVTVKNSR